MSLLRDRTKHLLKEERPLDTVYWKLPNSSDIDLSSDEKKTLSKKETRNYILKSIFNDVNLHFRTSFGLASENLLDELIQVASEDITQENAKEASTKLQTILNKTLDLIKRGINFTTKGGERIYVFPHEKKLPPDKRRNIEPFEKRLDAFKKQYADDIEALKNKE